MRNFNLPFYSLSALATVYAQNKSELSSEFDERKKYETTKEKIFNFRERHGIPGVSVCVTKGSKVVYNEGIGYSNVELKRKVSPDHLFRIASISKPLTSILFGTLVDRKIANFSDNLVSLFKNEYEQLKGRKITPLNILNHTSGIRHYEDNEFKSSEHYNDTKSALEKFINSPLLFKSGSKFSYSTYAFTLLARSIEIYHEKHYKQEVSFEHLLGNLFLKLGLFNTTIDDNKTIINGRVQHYTRNKKGILENAVHVDCSYKYAGGGILSSARDLCYFGDHLASIYLGKINDGIVSYDTLSKLWTISNIEMPKRFFPLNRMCANGWFLAKESGIPVNSNETTGYNRDRIYAFHNGDGTGSTTLLLISMPLDSESDKDQITVSILTNLDKCNSINNLGVSIARIWSSP